MQRRIETKSEAKRDDIISRARIFNSSYKLSRRRLNVLAHARDIDMFPLAILEKLPINSFGGINRVIMSNAKLCTFRERRKRKTA